MTVIGEFRFQTGRFAVWKHIPPFNVSILMIGDMKSRTEEAFFIAALKPCKPKAYLCKKVRKVSVFTGTKPFKTFQKQDLKVHDHQKKTYIFRKTTNRNKHTQNQDSSRGFMMHLVEIVILKGVFWPGVRHRVYTIQKKNHRIQTEQIHLQYKAEYHGIR